ncbi:MAG TPA: nuclear transport factor 2 family protein [Candidatus Dormibacteraeota bacterium]|jgi:ketosteroid isomerase-like protein|nr:nuclear transport factor 2 family protein [Candidatus Dormibacteraeota bacterium]
MSGGRESVVRGYFAAIDRGDGEGAAAMLHDDVVYHFPGRSPFASTYDGKQAVAGYLRRLSEYTGGTLRVQVHDVTSSAEHVVALSQVTATHAGVTLSWRLALIMHVDEESIREIWLHYGDQHAVDEFLSMADG